jgi:gliding motility-associated-like protein
VQNTTPYTHFFDEPGTYDVTLTNVSALGCVNTHTESNYLYSWASPLASFTVQPQPTDALNTEITFFNNSVGNGMTYEWIFDNINFLGVSEEVNPIFEFPLGIGGFYPVQLTVTDEHNCTDVFVFIVDIDEIFNVYIPNTFTPNGDDINEVFLVSGSDIDPDNFTLQVFNRWGDKIFETNDIDHAWTGSDHDGEFFVPDGMYLWRVVANSLSTTNKKELTGTVLLVR